MLDAAEFVGPFDDERLGLQKVAKYYYFPGWWEGSATLTMFINPKAYAALPQEYKAALQAACAEANQWSTAKYDDNNPMAETPTGPLVGPGPHKGVEAATFDATDVGSGLYWSMVEVKGLGFLLCSAT